MADNITYRFIQNVGDYFPSGYFTEDFVNKVQKCAGRTADEMKELNKPFTALRAQYEDYKNFIINAHPRVKDAIRRTHEWHTALLKVLGYDTHHAYQEPYVVSDNGEVVEMIPVRHILRSGDNISMLIMEMQHLISVDEQSPAGLFEQQYESEPDKNTRQQRYYAGQWADVIPAQYLNKERYHFSPAIINKAVTQIFLMPEERRPHFILMLAGNTVFLFDKDKWARGSYLQFSIDDLYTQGQLKSSRNHYALFQLLVDKNALAADGQTVLMDSLIEESYKNAYEVTKDLKEGVILAVESLANEALYYMKHIAHRPFGKKHIEADGTVVYDETDDDFEAEVKDDCLTIVYRLLFILFAESRPELEILPTGDEVYKRGYSFEALRDLEQVRLISDEARNGYFFDDSIKHLFAVLSKGFHKDDEAHNKSFRVRPIDSPMFNDGRLKQLCDVRIRNVKWQEIIRALSLSRSKKYCGRISYANLGVNQLGSVYESLLAYRGFYAEEDYIEVCKAGAPEDGTYLVPYSRMEAFDIREVICDEETGEPRRLPRGTFVYRLNGRDRQKSASYYTPEVLTRSTIKYTIKAIVDDVREGKRKPTELLDLKILEPAVGAAAFLNEVINQLAEAYMTYVEKKPAPDRYRDELQKVKAYIATHNVYGVDLNPTAIELGKLSLWLNVIHKDMETPFFANRLTVGNAVIGAWLKVYSHNEVVGKKGGHNKLKVNEWWTKAPHKVKFGRTHVKRTVNEVYHFLLPDKAMLAALGLKDMKKGYATEAKVMADRLKDWTAPVGEEQFRTLQRLSAKIDLLLREAMETQVNIEHLTNNRRDIWPHEVPQGGTIFRAYEQAEKYAEKERIFDTRYRHDNAYYKLKLVMDYWCALWFWEYQDAAALPTREEYWREIENLLDVSNDKLDRNTQRAMADANRVGEEIESEYGSERMTEEQAQIVAKSKEELLESTTAQTTLFADKEPERFKIAKRLADRYHFFHPMLEFIEVFWLRDGFDVICGNPPWLKLQFDDKAVLSERYPEVMIHNVSAPEARAMQTRFMEDASMRRIYEEEQMEVQCSSVFMNAFANYPLLIGQQTDLYKCILANCFSLYSQQGRIGIICPESIYDDAKGMPLRKELYHRLVYHFQYRNELSLFSEIGHTRMYGSQIFGSYKDKISFLSINNLFHPNTIDACLVHNGSGICLGIKDNNDNWNVTPHSDRIVHFTENELKVLANTFEKNSSWETTKLVSIHHREIINVLKNISVFPTHQRDCLSIITVCHDETIASDQGYITSKTQYPNWTKEEMIYGGPHFYVSNPLYKNPRIVCKNQHDYDVIDLEKISDDYSSRTNFIPAIELAKYRNLIKGFYVGNDANGNEQFDCWNDYYKVGFRKMLDSGMERTLMVSIFPKHSAHTHSIISSTFKSVCSTVELAGLCSSIVYDFYVKTLRASNLGSSIIESFPLGISKLYKPALFARTLRLNCVTNRYADLWSEVWDDSYKQEQWSIKDKRLAPWDTLTEEWNHDTPLRNYFERRMALVEIDVLAAMALGLTLDELIMMYEIQFPVLQQNENDTWYDRHGRIVFTCSKGLNGVGVDRPTWNRIREMHPGETYTHTLTSELYAGQTLTYEAPFTCCDRIADYRTAWAFFEKRL